MPVVATLAAALGWLIVALIAADVAGWLSTGAASGARATSRSDDPCGLRHGLPTGTDARCAFALTRPAGPSVTVELDQRWDANVLTQRLVVTDGAPHPMFALTARSAGARPLRLQRLFAVPGGDGREHVAYVIGLCGGTTCATSELWVVDPAVGGVAPLARLSVAGAPVVNVRPDGSLEVVESADRLGIGTLLVHTVRRQGDRYVVGVSSRQRSGPR